MPTMLPPKITQTIIEVTRDTSTTCAVVTCGNNVNIPITIDIASSTAMSEIFAKPFDIITWIYP